MSQEITTAFVQEFTEGISLLAQQKRSRLRNSVRVESGIVGESAFFDQVGLVTAQKVTTRHADTPLTDTPHSRRQVPLAPFKHADLIDVADKIRTLNDPTNSYNEAFSRAFGRAIDDELIAAAFATSSVGKDGTGTAPFPVAGFDVDAAGPMTVAAMLEAKQILDGAENDAEMGYFMAMNSQQISEILQDTTSVSGLSVGSIDFNDRRAVMEGSLNFYAGFNIVRTERLQVATNGTDLNAIAWAKNMLLLGIGEDINGEIDRRPDKNYSTQVFMSMDIGATRMEETGVVRVASVI